MHSQSILDLLDLSKLSRRRMVLVHLTVVAILAAFADVLVPFYAGLVLGTRRQVAVVGFMIGAFASLSVLVPETVLGQGHDVGAGPAFWMTFHQQMLKDAALASVVTFLGGILLRQAVLPVGEARTAVAVTLASAMMLFGGHQLATRTASEGAARLRQAEDHGPAWAAANQALEEIGRISRDSNPVDPDLVAFHRFKINYLFTGKRLPDHMASLEAFKEYWKQERAKLEEHLKLLSEAEGNE